MLHADSIHRDLPESHVSVSQFVNLPLHVLDHNAIQHEMRAIGERPAEETNEHH